MSQQRFQFNWLDIPDERRRLAEAMQFQFSQTQQFTPADLQRLQFVNLQNLLDHSLQHVPYYQNRAYKRITSWHDWHQVPVLSRSEVQEHSESLHGTIDLREREGRVYKKSSSGSTGRPIVVSITDRTDVFWKAITLRDHLWQKRDFSQTMAVIKMLPKDQVGPPGIKAKSWGPSSGLLYATGPSQMISSLTDIREQFAWLQQLRPGYLLTYPSILRELALMNIEAAAPLQFLDVSTMGETLSPDTRELVRRAFNAKVCDIYSCQEIGYLALQCPRHDHYHIQAETCFVEILDDNNRPCAPGEMGRVVATHLHNKVMPLIRYEIGDYAIAGDNCDCGIRLPVLDRVIGRTRNLVTYPDGTRSWPVFSMLKLVALLPDAQFQLVQTALDKMLLRIGTKRAVPDTLREQMKQIVNERLGYPFTMDFEILEAIPRSRSGKYEEFLSELTDENS